MYCISQNAVVLRNEAELKYWRRIRRKYIKIKPEIKNLCDQLYLKLNNNRTIGVLCRGTDYISQKPKGHPVQPDVEDVIKKVEELMVKDNCNQVFLATEDVNIYQRFSSHFGKRLMITEDKFVDYDPLKYKWINEYYDSKTIENAIRYFGNIYVLSKCDVLVAGVVSGTAAALIFSDGYEDSYLFDLGKYE